MGNPARIPLASLLIVLLLSMFFPAVVAAEVPYKTWFVDRQNGDFSFIQPVYLPKLVIDGNRMDMPLSSPSDLYIADNDDVYIADTGNHRIVHLTSGGTFIRSIGTEEGPGRLNAPEGVFVAPDGTIYAANTGGRSIVKYSADGAFVASFGKPQSELLFDDYHFLPSKLVVDRRGVMYIVVKNTYQGLFRMNPEGEFAGFFGANKTKLSFTDRLQRFILSAEQYAKEAPKRPNAMENISLTSDGFLIITSSGDVSDGQIRKLNAGGQDDFQNRPFDSTLVDTVADEHGFLYSYSRRFGEMSIRDPNGMPLIQFGTGSSAARQHGVANFPTAIELNSRYEIFLLDSALNMVQVFQRTDFGDIFMKANELYFEGNYEASAPYWEEVRRQNGMMDIALTGLGKAEMFAQNYEAAVTLFEQARDPEGYSKAFWYVRYEWLRTHFVTMLAGFIVGGWALSFLYRRRKSLFGRVNWPPLARRYGRELGEGFRIMLRPYDGFYRLKEQRVSLIVIGILLLAAVGANLYSIFGSSLIAFPQDKATANIPLSLGLLLVPWVTWVIANYLVSSTKGGEGRLREVLQASSFALVPYIVFTLISTAISNVLVYDEWVVYEMLNQAMWIWIAVLFFVMTQVTHNFDFLETARNIVITIFTIAVIWLFVIVMVALSSNFYNFMVQIYREVTFGA